MHKLIESSADFVINSSEKKFTMIALLHVLALLACFTNDLAIASQAVLLILLVISFLKLSLNLKLNPLHLRYSAKLGWHLLNPDDSYCTLKIKPSTVLSKHMIVIDFSKKLQHGSLLIFNDALNSNDYRRLLVLLKLTATGGIHD